MRSFFSLLLASHLLSRLLRISTGFENSVAVSSQNELADVLPRLREGPGMQFVSIKVRTEKLGFSLPPKDGVYLKTRFRKAILGDAAVLSS
jgi:hypothetical protein